MNKAIIKRTFNNTEKIGTVTMTVDVKDNNENPHTLSAEEDMIDYMCSDDRDLWYEIFENGTKKQQDLFKESLQLYEEELFEDLKNSIIEEAKEKNVDPEKIHF